MVRLPAPGSSARIPPGRIRALLLVFAGWTLYGVVSAQIIRAFVPPVARPRPSFLQLLVYALSEAWLWALLTVPTVLLARRVPFTTGNWARRIPLHIGFAAGIHVVHAAGTLLLQPLVRPGFQIPLRNALLNGILFDVFIYAALVAIVHAMDAQTQALRLRNQLLEADLRMLRMQLQPHFLFNTLNAVSELVHQDAAAAERAITRLADLLRWTLQSSERSEVSLREELDALSTYLEIQRIRHGDGLQFRVDAAPDTLDLGVPGLLLQPLVENAIRHGIGGSSDGMVVIEATRTGDRLHLRVRDDGRGFASGHREGTGLRTTRARLAGLCGDRQSLVAGGGSRGGDVEITLPAHPPVDARDGNGIPRS